MKQYQVTRKMQVTIPKTLADRAGIRPGDSVVFEETRDDAIMIKKVAGSKIETEKVRIAFDRFAKDMTKVRTHLLESEARLNEGLSRHIGLE